MNEAQGPHAAIHLAGGSAEVRKGASLQMSSFETPKGGATALKRSGRKEKGAAELFEAALVLSMLLTLVLGTISIARAFSVYQTLTHFAQDTARAAAVSAGAGAFSCPSWSSVSSLPTAIQGELSAASINSSGITNLSVTCDATTNAGTSLQEPEVHVSFTYAFQFVIPFTPLNYQTRNFQISAAEKEEN